MAKMTFTPSDVRRILRLPNGRAVEDLINSGTLEVSAYTPRGRPLFNADAVQRAAARAISVAAENRSA